MTFRAKLETTHRAGLEPSAAAAEQLSSKLTRRDGHSSAGRTNHCYVDIDNDVVIWADRCWCWDLSRLCWDTGCDIWQKEVERRHGCWLKRHPGRHTASFSFSDAVQSSRTLRAYLESNGCLDSADGGCVHRREGVGLNGARRCAHTPLKRTVYWRLKPYA